MVHVWTAKFQSVTTLEHSLQQITNLLGNQLKTFNLLKGKDGNWLHLAIQV